MKNRLLNRFRVIAVSATVLVSSGCQMCGEPGYYGDYSAYPSYYRPAPCLQQPVYFQQTPYPSIYNGSQAVSPTPIYNGNRINNAPVTEKRAEPAAIPPKPVPEEIPTPQSMQNPNLKSLKPINKTA